LGRKKGIAFFGTSETARLVSDEANYPELVMTDLKIPALSVGEPGVHR